MMIDYSIFNDLFYYDNGILYNKVTRSYNAKAGDKAGSNDGRYLSISYKCKKYYVHRIIYYLNHGLVPRLIDHIDKDKLNNLISNLRDANKSINAVNTGVMSSNKTGYNGVFLRSNGRYLSYITRNNKRIYLGTYSTPEEAGEKHQEAISNHGY